jgi:hypothetical protein
LISKITKPNTETGITPIEDFVIPNLPEFPARNENQLSEERQTALPFGESKSLEHAN